MSTSGVGGRERFATGFRALGALMYRVWYWLNDELCMISCGRNGSYAWRLVEDYHEPYLHYHPSYLPWLEYVKGGDARESWLSGKTE